jgi:hypothetical protein
LRDQSRHAKLAAFSIEARALADKDFDREEFEKWLEGHPPEVAVALASRAALRVLPIVGWSVKATEESAGTVFLPLFRANTLAWVFVDDRIRDRVNRTSASARASVFAPNATASSRASVIGVYGPSSSRVTAAAFASASARASVFADRASACARAVAAAASAASARASASSCAFASALRIDRSSLGAGVSAQDLAWRPMWPEGIPKDLERDWKQLRKRLLALDPNWSIWTDWYDDRLAGRPADMEYEIARANLPEKLWKKGAKAVNAELVGIRDGFSKSDEAASSNAATTVTETDFLSATTDGERGSDSSENAGELYPETVEFAPGASEATRSDPELAFDSTVGKNSDLAASGEATARQRATEKALIAQAPVSAVIEDGNVGARDSPPDAKPPVDHPEDLEQRLCAQSALAGKLVATLTEMPHNLGPYLGRDLAHFQQVTEDRPPVWYGLDDAAQDLRDHLILLEDLSWPGTTRQSVERLCRRTEELRPLLQPRQPEPSEPETPEPVLDPDRVPRDVLEEVFINIEGAIQADGGRVLGPTFVEATEHYTQEGRGALETSDSNEQGEAVRQGRLSRALKGLGGLLGTSVKAIGRGTATNTLSNPGSAALVGERFKALFEWIASFFS